MYVFEIVRPGARSSIIDDPTFKEIVPDSGLLTPQGMRQRYLLGKYNQVHYGASLGDSDLLEKGEGLYVQSTDYNRTIQSGYSELLGMINGTNLTLTPNLT